MRILLLVVNRVARYYFPGLSTRGTYIVNTLLVVIVANIAYDGFSKKETIIHCFSRRVYDLCFHGACPFRLKNWFHHGIMLTELF